ncbi:DNA/RNA polymerases superfamily protein [Euphorbia peplus]|nr:DNA/RNA polymerases superfamily protein [Euphorbia peplus]
MHDPKTSHMASLKRIMRYVKGTLDLGLLLTASSLDSLISYTDADWGGCPDTRRSTSGYCVYLGDNLISWSAKRAVYLSDNPIQHQRTKHIEMDIHFVREKVAKGDVRVLHIPSRHQIADIFTKGLPQVLFDDFRSSLNVRLPPVSTTGVY